MNEKNLSSSNLYCELKKVLESYKGYLDTNCEETSEESEQWFIDNEFEIFNISGRYEMVVTEAPNFDKRKDIKNRGQSCPSFYSFTNTKIRQQNGELFDVGFALLQGTDYASFPAEFIFTDTKYENAINDASYLIKNPISCSLTFWIDIPKPKNGVQKIYIKTRVAKSVQGNWESETAESLHNKFLLSDPLLNNVSTWNFQFRNHKFKIIQLVNNSGIFPHNEWMAGLVCGFADGVLNDLKFLASAIGYMENARKNLTLSVVMINVTFMTLIQNQSLKDALIGQAAKSYATVYDMGKKANAFFKFFANPQDAITAFIDGICTVIAQGFVNLVGYAGVFESGYTAGGALYIALGAKVVVEAFKFSSALVRGAGSAIFELTEDIAKTAGKQKVLDELEKVGVVVRGSLSKYPHLMNWHGTTMPAWLKISVVSQSDDFLKFFDDMIKNYPKIKDEMVTLPKLFDYTESLHKDWWAKYGLAGMSKRINPPSQYKIPAEYSKMIGDLEVTTNGLKARLRTLVLGEETGNTIGRVFDDNLSKIISDGFKGHGFNDLPSGQIRNKFETLANDGYQMVLKEAPLELNGVFKPDMLFVKKQIINNLEVITDIKYIEVKYLDDVTYNQGGQANVASAPKPVQVTNTSNKLLEDINGLEINGTNNTLTISSVERIYIRRSDLKLIID